MIYIVYIYNNVYSIYLTFPFLCRFFHASNFVRRRNLKFSFEFTALPLTRVYQDKTAQNWQSFVRYSWTKSAEICRQKWLEFSGVHITEKKYARNFLICEIRCWKIQNKLEERACGALYLPSFSKGSKSDRRKCLPDFATTGLITDRQRKTF